MQIEQLETQFPLTVNGHPILLDLRTQDALHAVTPLLTLWNVDCKLGCFLPGVEVLVSLSEAEVNSHRLTHIKHYEGYMYCLTFKFSSQTLSPPAGTYHKEPSGEEAIAREADIASIQFKCTKYDGAYCVLMESEKKACLFELMPADESH